MAQNDFNLYRIKRTARKAAWRGPSTTWNRSLTNSQRASLIPAQFWNEEDLRGSEEQGSVTVYVPTRPGTTHADTNDDDLKDTIPHTSEEDDGNRISQNIKELFWDPYGELSNHLGAWQFKPSRSNFTHNSRASLESPPNPFTIDMHVLNFVAQGQSDKIILMDTD
ncbi:hypothetical protein NHQ30_003871 [Ciborinia camelliae]|nr:hypothetical protein NHQ30_003871 [Ciborinia camelliae]